MKVKKKWRKGVVIVYCKIGTKSVEKLFNCAEEHRGNGWGPGFETFKSEFMTKGDSKYPAVRFLNGSSTGYCSRGWFLDRGYEKIVYIDEFIEQSEKINKVPRKIIID